MHSRLLDILEEKKTILADGAIGTNLFAMGLASGEPPEGWNQDYPERVQALHQDFVDAGSDLLLTNSFGGTNYRLKLHGLENDVKGINFQAASLARNVVNRADRSVVVAGSVGPTGELLEPLGKMNYANCVKAFSEQMEALADGGVDVIWIETISAPEEFHAACQAAVKIGLPVCATMSFDSAGRTMMGLTPEAFAALAYEQKLAGFGANCGVGASDLMSSILSFKRADQKRTETDRIPIISKANCGIPSFKDGEIVYSGTEELMADYALLARATGASIIGGCCGTKPSHITAMRVALDDPAHSHDLAVLAISKLLGTMSEGARDLAEGRHIAGKPARQRTSRRQR